MAIIRMFRRPSLVLLMLGAGCLGLDSGEGRADRISLRGGGQIRGKVVPDPGHPDRLIVLTEQGKTPLSFEKPRIVRVIAEPSALDDYVVKRAAAPDTAEAQYELGLWCEEHKLTDLAELHYEAALRQDQEFAPAHRKLGHVPSGGRWLTGDEIREAQGLVRYKGRWITRDERDRREARAAAAAAQTSWVRRIRLLRQALFYGTDDRRREAEAQLMEIRDPIAVAALVQVLGEDEGVIRMLLDRILGLIPGPEATSALVTRILVEFDPDVRYGTLEELEQRKEPIVIPQLVGALRSSNPMVINRAAWTLAHLNAVTAVPKLVPALITTQYRVVVSNAGGGSSGSSFGSVAPTSSYGIPIAYNGSTIAYLTPPAVGPGVLGYGATAVPVYSAYSSPSLPVATPSGIRGPVPRIVPITYHNVEVLAALIRLTGRDFGFDVASWHRWVSTSFQPDPSPIRRVPQP